MIYSNKDITLAVLYSMMAMNNLFYKSSVNNLICFFFSINQHICVFW